MTDPLEDFARRAVGFEGRERIDAAAVEVMDALREAHVGALLLKGPVTASWLYARGEVRGYTDCDVLADPYRFASAGRVLRAAGFHLHGDEATHPEVRDEGRSQIWHRVPGDVWIDLQWRLPGFERPPGEVWALLWARRETMTIASGRVTVADESARALHLATALDAGSAKALSDLDRAIERLESDVWERAARLADDIGARTALISGLSAVSGGPSLLARLQLSPE